MADISKFHSICKKPILIFYSRGSASVLAIKRRFFKTSADEQYWSNRSRTSISDRGDWNTESTDWIDDYWNSRNHPHRALLINTIKKYHPSSILEIGCNCGPNLFLLAKIFPDARIMGIDINMDAVVQGNQYLAEQGIKNVTLQVGMADDLKLFENNEFDVVFTDAVMIYIGPDKIMNVINEIVRVARKASLLHEWHNEQSDFLGWFCGHWVRNYSLINGLFPQLKVSTTKLPKEIWNDAKWQRFGYIIEVIKKYG
jgi:ubiquinone/menaquinone biosynthesis C-methylase UbiE